MANHKQLNPDKRTSSRPSGASSNVAMYGGDLDQYISERIESAATEFFEIEAFEVNEIVNDVYGGVRGIFLEEKNQPIKGGVVRPLRPNITQIPLIGEHVAVIEFDDKHYYIDIINRIDSPNENALAGTTSYDSLNNYKTFRRDDKVKHISINEGDIVFNGRFNNSITLGSNGANKPITKIVVGHRVIENNLFKETIDNDDASIYLVSDEASVTLDGQRVSGKKVLIKSGGIFISSGDVRLGTSVENDLEPVVKGLELKKVLDQLIATTQAANNVLIAANQTAITTLRATAQPAAILQAQELEEKNKEIVQQNLELEAAVQNSAYLSTRVKTS